MDTPPHREAAPLIHHCYDGTRALLLASPVVPASSLIAPVWIYFSVGRPLPLGSMLFGLERAHSLWNCKADCLKCDTCWPPLSSLLGAREPCFPAGNGWEEQERVKAPFVWLGRASGALLAEAGTGLLLGPRGH